jgi:hypothetical protein
MATSRSQPDAGWYRDPSGRHEHRWWDGNEWTPYVITLGLRSVDYGDDPLPATPAREAAAAAADAASAAEVAVGSTPTERWRWPLAVWCTVALGAVLLVVGALLPWAEASSASASFSRTGIDGNGAATLVAAVAVVLFCLVVPRPKVAAALVIGVAVLAGAVGVHDALDISHKADRLVAALPKVSAGVGIGVWITIVGAVIALAGGILAFVEATRRS